MLVGEKSKPPVVRIQDFNKLQYEKKKREKEQRKKTRQHELKEVQFKAHIAEGDLDIKVKRINDFLEKGHKVKIAVRLKGRERYIPGVGDSVVERVLAKVAIPHKVIKQKSAQTIVILEP